MPFRFSMFPSFGADGEAFLVPQQQISKINYKNLLFASANRCAWCCCLNASLPHMMLFCVLREPKAGEISKRSPDSDKTQYSTLRIRLMRDFFRAPIAIKPSSRARLCNASEPIFFLYFSFLYKLLKHSPRWLSSEPWAKASRIYGDR